MPGSSSQDLLQQTVNAFASRANDYADGIANRLGQPLSGTQLTRDQAVQRWNFSPLGSTQAADAQYHQLVAQGMPPGQALDQVYPMRSLLIKGASVEDSIKTAQQIQGWAAEASGVPVPEQPKQSTMPLFLAQQRAAQAAQPPPAPIQGPPVAPPPMMPQAPPVQPVMGMPGQPAGVGPVPPAGAPLMPAPVMS